MAINEEKKENPTDETFTCEYCGEEYTLTTEELEELEDEGIYDPTSYCSVQCAKDGMEDEEGNTELDDDIFNDEENEENDEEDEENEENEENEDEENIEDEKV
jgi:hypothetical protein